MNRKARLSIQFFIAHLICSDVNAALREINKTLFRELTQVTDQVKKACPPKDCVVVSIGRSLTLISTYLQLDHKDYAWNLPLSNFRYDVEGPWDQEEKEDEEIPFLSEDEHKKLFDHFHKFFPSPAKTKDRRILLVDYSSSGKSLVSAKDHIGKYLQITGRTHESSQLQALPILSRSDSNQISEFYGDLIQPPIELSPESSLLISLVDETFKDYSEYLSYDLKEDEAVIENSTPHEQLRNKLKELQDLRKRQTTKRPRPLAEKQTVFQQKKKLQKEEQPQTGFMHYIAEPCQLMRASEIIPLDHLRAIMKELETRKL